MRDAAMALDLREASTSFIRSLLPWLLASLKKYLSIVNIFLALTMTSATMKVQKIRSHLDIGIPQLTYSRPQTASWVLTIPHK